MSEVAEKALDVLRKEAAELYRRRGFQARIGFGKKPALLVIDLAIGWTDATYPLGLDLDSVVRNTKEVVEVARMKKISIVFTTDAS